MDEIQKKQIVQRALDRGAGVFRLMPAWVPRSFCVPGRRLRLHPSDWYALGANRGGIDERWFASTTHADNGPLTPPDEGLSYIYDDGDKVTLKDAITLEGEAILGKEQIDAYGGLVMYSKFFDNMYPLPHHVHQNDEYASHVGMLGKPEAYYYPPQYNAALDTFPYTFFGLEPGTTKDQVVDCLKRWDEGDNRILTLSKAYRLTPGTGWDVPPGILHAPGTMCTYEPQRASDVFAMWQSLIADCQLVDRSMLVKNVPADKHHDYDYIMGMLDWEANIDPDFARNHFTEPRYSANPAGVPDAGFQEKWITYGSEFYSAKELTVLPGRTVSVRDPIGYGLICVQGYGRIARYPIASPTMIRFGQMTEDEFFVTASAAQQGVEFTNLSTTEPLVILKHFNPGHSEMPKRV